MIIRYTMSNYIKKSLAREKSFSGLESPPIAELEEYENTKQKKQKRMRNKLDASKQRRIRRLHREERWN